MIVSEFIILFISLVDKLALAENHCELLLNFVKMILNGVDDENNVPTSYYKLKKTLPIPMINSFILCKNCNEEVKIKIENGKKSKICSSEMCASRRLSHLRNKDLVKVYNSNIISQIREILNNHHMKING